MLSKRLQKVLSEETNSPGEYLKAILSLKKISARERALKLNCSSTYIINITNNHDICGVASVLKISETLDIDPYIFNKVCYDYKLRKLIENKT